MPRYSSVCVALPFPERGIGDYLETIADMEALGKRCTVRNLFQYGFDAIYEAGFDIGAMQSFLNQLTADVFEDFDETVSASTIYELIDQTVTMAFYDIKDFVVDNDLYNVAIHVMTVDDDGFLVEVCLPNETNNTDIRYRA